MLLSKRFRGLPKKQADVFEQIATGKHGGHHPATLKALQEKGLIGFEVRKLGRDAFGEIVVQVPYVLAQVHIEWCEWCTEQQRIRRY